MNKLSIKSKILNIAIIFMIAIFFILDRFLKSIALQGIYTTKLIGNIFTFNFTPNYYIAFSLPIKGLILEILISVLIFAILASLLYLYKKKANRFLLFGLLLILLGAISNLVDRFQFGYVVDYLYLKYFTVFNIADILITCGSILILLHINKKTG